MSKKERKESDDESSEKEDKYVKSKEKSDWERGYNGNHKDEYGNVHSNSDNYKQSYPGQVSTETDAYGTPIYDHSSFRVCYYIHASWIHKSTH